MKKFLISAIVVVVVVLLGVLIFGDKSNSHVADIESNVSELETELVDIEGMIAADELTEEEATAAYQDILDHLNAIDASVEASQTVTLSDEEKQRLVDAFQQLAEAVSDYSDVLNVLEGTADVDTTETIISQLQEVVSELENYIDAVDAAEASESATSSEEVSDEDETPMMEDGTITDEDTGANSEESTTTEN